MKVTTDLCGLLDLNGLSDVAMFMKGASHRIYDVLRVEEYGGRQMLPVWVSRGTKVWTTVAQDIWKVGGA